MRIKRVGLKHHGQVALAGAHLVDRPAADGDMAAGLALQTGDNAQQGRFATARRPNQGEKFTVANVQIDVTQDPRRAKALGDVLKGDAGHEILR